MFVKSMTVFSFRSLLQFPGDKSTHFKSQASYFLHLQQNLAYYNEA